MAAASPATDPVTTTQTGVFPPLLVPMTPLSAASVTETAAAAISSANPPIPFPQLSQPTASASITQPSLIPVKGNDHPLHAQYVPTSAYQPSYRIPTLSGGGDQTINAGTFSQFSPIRQSGSVATSMHPFQPFAPSPTAPSPVGGDRRSTIDDRGTGAPTTPRINQTFIRSTDNNKPPVNDSVDKPQFPPTTIETKPSDFKTRLLNVVLRVILVASILVLLFSILMVSTKDGAPILPPPSGLPPMAAPVAIPFAVVTTIYSFALLCRKSDDDTIGTPVAKRSLDAQRPSSNSNGGIITTPVPPPDQRGDIYIPPPNSGDQSMLPTLVPPDQSRADIIIPPPQSSQQSTGSSTTVHVTRAGELLRGLVEDTTDRPHSTNPPTSVDRLTDSKS